MRKDIRDKKIEKNGYGQKTITGKIILSQDVTMQNESNFGKAMYDKNWAYPKSITAKKGTEVFYRFQETRSGNYHEVSLFTQGHKFSKSIKQEG